MPDDTTLIWVPVASGSSISAALVVHDLPEQSAVVIRSSGPGIDVGDALARIADHARTEGIDLVAPSGRTLDAVALAPFVRLLPGSQGLTEVWWPLAERSGGR